MNTYEYRTINYTVQTPILLYMHENKQNITCCQLVRDSSLSVGLGDMFSSNHKTYELGGIRMSWEEVELGGITLKINCWKLHHLRYDIKDLLTFIAYLLTFIA